MPAAPTFAAARRGLTLIEVLVVMGLLTIVGTAITNYFISTSRASTFIAQKEQTRAEMTLANQLLISRLREACEVYASGTTLDLRGVAGSRRGTRTTWTVGTDPMLAFIAPTAGSDTFYAFYLLSPADYAAQITDDTQKLAPAPAGDSTLLLMQYSVPLPAGSCNASPATAPTTALPAGGQAQLVTQHVREPQSGEPAFQVGTDLAMQFKLRFERQAAGKTAVYPSLASNPMQADVVGRNLP